MRHSTTLVMFIALGVVIAACAPASTVAYAEQPRETDRLGEPDARIMAEINDARAAFGEAYKKRDPELLSELYHRDAVFAGTLHPYFMEGRENIQGLWKFYFETYPTARIFFWSSAFRLLASNPSHRGVVVQDAYTLMAMPDVKGQVRNIQMRLTIVWVKVAEYKSGSRALHWQIAHMHGSETPRYP